MINYEYGAVADTLSMLAHDHSKRDEERHKAFEFWKSHCDAIDVYTDIVSKTKAVHQKEKASDLESFFA